jgi:dihydroxyacetone kinase DhaKLM complex PTS-EIIA-like component DhaM
MILKMQDLSDKLRAALMEKEALALVQKDQTKKMNVVEVQLLESTYYTSALEKENAFLRLEIERSKYSKDKEGYSKFLSGLLKTEKSSSV